MSDTPLSADDFVKSLEKEMSADDFVASMQDEMESPDVADARELAGPRVQEDPETALAQARELSAAAPAPPRPLKQPFNERPWHQQWSEVQEDVPMYTAAENAGNTLMSNTADEAGAALAELPIASDLLDEPGREYAAGSEQEDLRRTLERERGERNEHHPRAALGGQVAGGVIQNALIPGARAAQAAGNVGLVAANMIGEGHGGMGERVDQAVDTAVEHPYRTGFAMTAPVLAQGVTKGAGKLKEGLENIAGRQTVAAFTTPGQRNALVDNAGPGAVEKLGKNVRAMKLHQTGWWNPLAPNAETFYKNAVKARQKAGEAMGKREAEILAAGDPPVQFTPVAEDLEAAANEVSKRALKKKAKPEADYMRETAQDLRDVTKVPVSGPIRTTYEDVPFTKAGGGRDIVAPSEVQPAFQKGGGGRDIVAPSEVQPPFMSSGAGREYVPFPKEMAEYNRAMKRFGRATTMPEPPQSVQFEGPTQPAREVSPQEWFDHLKDVESFDSNGPLPEGPMSIPENAPQRIDPTRDQIMSYNKKAEQVAQNQSEMTPPVRPEPALRSGPERPTEFTGPDEHLTLQGPERPTEFTGPDEHLTLQGPQPEPIATREPPIPEFESGEVPFSQALADKRYADEHINHVARGGYEGAPMQEQVLRRTRTGISEQINKGLDDAVGRKQLKPELVEDWRTQNKNFGTAAAVEDPAQALMQSQYGGGLGIKDIAGAGLAGAFGLSGPASIAAAKTSQGRLPGFLANQAGRSADTAAAIEATASMPANSAIARTVAPHPHPITVAQQRNPEAPKQEIITIANDTLKEQVQKALQKGSDWFHHLLD